MFQVFDALYTQLSQESRGIELAVGFDFLYSPDFIVKIGGIIDATETFRF
jgi:hypothetical protein